MADKALRHLQLRYVPLLGIACLVTGCSSGSTPGNPYFVVAKSQWKATASSYAYELSFEYLEVAASLQVGLSHDSVALTENGKHKYDTAIAALQYLAGLPETDVSPEQQATAQADLAALDRFFSTPTLGM